MDATMSHQWMRRRGLANPIPAVEPGGVELNEWDPGEDVTLPDDHFARLHNPANGRVPPQLPAAITRPRYPEFPQLQYARYFTMTPGSLDSALSFQAKSVRVDNYSSHWIYIQSAGMYIPPLVYGNLFLLDPAVATAQWIQGVPPGHTDGTALESLVVTIWYEASLPPTVGFSVPAT